MAEIIGKALIIMTNNCNSKLDGKITFKKENDIEGFAPQIVYNNITVKEQELQINERHIETIVIGILSFTITTIIVIFIKHEIKKKNVEKVNDSEKYISVEKRSLKKS